ncbi:MAG: type II toxin-antitoxin system VapC family toxin [Proteobacteria bacterium]|nr:type II toxin-antitoxin system VapC family toxin [Pseudomonadota bacterium]
MNNSVRGLLLDTYVWIWLVNGDPELGADALAAIERAAAAGSVLVAAISVWEVAMIEAKGRIVLAKPCAQWVKEALSAPGLALAPLTPEIAVESCQLPGTFHNDLADRLIVATARVGDATLVTRDERILAYGAAGHASVLAA